MAANNAPGPATRRPTRARKRTSQGIWHTPLNKHKRRGWKAYRGQGRPR